MDQFAVFESAKQFLRTEVRPIAELIDRDVNEVRLAMDGLFERGLMALKVPVELGGSGLSEELFREFQEEIARASGTLAFLATQHQSAASMIAKGDNKELAERVIPQMAGGGERIGIGFSQLRRKGPPMMRAEPKANGYVIDGTVPWATGYTMYNKLLVGATLPDGQSLYVLAPFTVCETVSVSPPMKLAAMESAQTVEVYYKAHSVSPEDVVMVRPSDFIQRNDMINVTLQGHFAVGCALAGVDVVREAAKRKSLEFLSKAADALEKEINDCRTALIEAADRSGELATDERLKLRGWVIELATRCGHAAVVASSGAANSLDHPAQRVYREAIVFSVSAQTTEIMESTISRLARTG